MHRPSRRGFFSSDDSVPNLKIKSQALLEFVRYPVQLLLPRFRIVVPCEAPVLNFGSSGHFNYGPKQ